MSTTIDRKVVEMQFDNSNFERNAKTSMSTLDKLKEKLDFASVAKGLMTLGLASSKLNFSTMVDGLNQVGQKFDWMYIIGKRVLENLTDRAMQFASRITKSLTVDQLASGWNKYADKTSAVQTIMAATGDSIEKVNDQLEKLNWFTDETSYSFTDMVSNIGKFTSAGIDLETAVTSMQGIATWAAISGQNPAAASRAMYNLSQAMGMGSVLLMDWRSIENANMGTKAFKEEVLETAEALGILEKQGEDTEGTLQYLIKGTDELVSYKNFRNSLSEKWFTNDVLNSVLNKYGAYATAIKNIQDALGTDTANETMRIVEQTFSRGKFTGTAADFQSISDSLSISVKEAEALYYAYNSVGKEAFKAAQEAKTFAEAMNATRDAVSSAFMNIFESIFGDYQDAKEVWTGLANEMYDIFAGPIANVGETLKEALYHRNTWDDFMNDLEEGGYKVDKFEEAMLKVAESMDITYGETEDENGEIIKAKYSLDELITKFGSLERVSEKGIISTEMLSKTFEELGISAEDAAGYMEKYGEVTEMGTRAKAIQAIVTLYGKLRKAMEPIGKAWSEVFPPFTVETVKNLVNRLSEFAEQLQISEPFLQNVHDISKGLFDVLKVGFDVLSNVFSVVKRLAGPVFTFILDILGDLGSTISSIIDSSSVEPIFDFFNNLIDYVVPSQEAMEKISDAFERFFSIFFVADENGTGKKFNLIEGFFLLLVKIGEKVSEVANSIWQSLKKLFEGLSIKNISDLINSGLIATFLANLVKWVKNLNDESKENGITKFFNSVSDVMQEIQDKLKGPKLMEIAKSIALMAGSIFVLSLIEPGRVGVAVAALAALAVGLVHAVGALNALDIKDGLNNKVSKLTSLAFSLLIMATALKLIGTMDSTQIINGLGGLFGILGMLYVFTDKIKETNSKGLVKLAFSMILFAAAMKIFATMNIDEIGAGLLAMGGILGELLLFMQMTKDLNTAKSTTGIVGFSAAMILFAAAMKIFATMSWDEIGRGLFAVGFGLLEFALAAKEMENSVKGAFAILIMANAMMIFAPALWILSRLEWDEIAKGLLALAGAFIVMGVAAKLLKGSELTLLALAGSFALIGIGAAALAVGIVALATAVSVGASEIAAGLIVVVSSVASLIPLVLMKIGEGIIAFVDLIRNSITTIVGAVVDIISAILDGINAVVPKFVETVMNVIVSVLRAIETNIAVIVQLLGSIITQAIYGLIDYIAPIVDALMEIVITTINALSTAINEHGQEVLDAIGGLLASIWNFVVLTLQNIVGELPLVGEEIAGYLDYLKIDVEQRLNPTEAMNTGKSFGSSLADGTTIGLEEKKPGLEAVVTEIKDAAVTSFDMSDDFAEAADNAATGFTNTLWGRKDSIASAAASIGRSAARGLRSALDEHSPSKVFASIGDFATQGFILGITDSLGSVTKATSQMGDASIAGMNTAISRIGDSLDSTNSFSNQPVIRPVLDLTDVTNGANQMRGILTDDYNLALSGSVTSSRLSNSIKNQNGGNTMADAIASLKDDFTTMTNEIKGMKIVMDSGAVVGSISSKMDKALGTISTYKGRGNTY